MSSRLRPAVGMAALVIALLCIASPRHAHATGVVGARVHAAQLGARGLDRTSVIAQWGFGQRQNSYAWGMTWFKGKLYVGTGRNVACVEEQTVDFYFPFAKLYQPTVFPSTHCPRNPYDLALRAQIWQYTPETGRWKMVYRAPQIRNPRARGKFVAADIAYRDMTVVTDPQGRKVMFASGVTADEYVPELARRHPPRLLRSYDGIHFENISTPFIVHKSGPFPDHRPIGFRGIVQWRGRLYVLASTALTGDGQVFRVDHPWSRRARFRQVTPPWMDLFELQKFAGRLYVGGASYEDGYYVYRTIGTHHRPYRFKKILAHGAGRGKYITSALAMNVYRHQLYVTGVGWYCTSCGTVPLTEMVRIDRRDQWQVVVGNPRKAYGKMRYPISGLEDNFENIFNSHIWRLANSGRAMYAGTNSWSWLMQVDKTSLDQNHGLLQSVLAGVLGFNVFGTCDGYDFYPVTQDAFGVDFYDFGVRNLVGVHGGFYIGSADHAHGTRIFHLSSTYCNSGVSSRAARAAAAHGVVAPPRALMTDVQRKGTVLSWDAAPLARHYQVMRASYTQIPLSYKQPPTLPGGAMFEDAAPVPTTPGSPDSATVNLTVPSRYETIGTTSNLYFVDRSRRPRVKYAYMVMAESGFGAMSNPSNVQVVPDPRPPATFDQLEGLLPPTARASIAGGPQARWHRGERAATLAELRRMARRGGGDEAGIVAGRLARRLQYRDLAGGPVGG